MTEKTPAAEAASGLKELQKYYAGKAKERGWEYEQPNEVFLLLLKEVAELGPEVASYEKFRERSPQFYENLPNELADVLLYVIHLANRTKIDLVEAVANKEVINDERQAKKLAKAAKAKKKWYDEQPKYHAENSGKNPLRKDGLYGKAAQAADGDWYSSH